MKPPGYLCLSDFFLHVPDLLSVAYKITQSVQEGRKYKSQFGELSREAGLAISVVIRSKKI
jgi:hypothetical protein